MRSLFPSHAVHEGFTAASQAARLVVNRMRWTSGRFRRIEGDDLALQIECHE